MEKVFFRRFNQRGLTGCLNFLNTKLDNISIEVINGQCEDSLNIINSEGLISSIKVSNSYQDAVDLDFSDIKINNTSPSIYESYKRTIFGCSKRDMTFTSSAKPCCFANSSTGIINCF